MKRFLPIILFCFLLAPAYAMQMIGFGGGTTCGCIGTGYFCDDFETGDFTNWTYTQTDSGDLSVGDGTSYCGNNQLIAYRDDSNNIYALKDWGAGYTTIWLHGYIRFSDVDDTNPVAGGIWRYIYIWDDPQNDIVAYIGFKVSTDATRVINGFSVSIYNGSGYDQQTGSISPSADVDYEWKIQLVKGVSSDGIVNAWWGTPGNLSQIITYSSQTYYSSWDAGELWVGVLDSEDMSTWTFYEYTDNIEVAGSDIW